MSERINGSELNPEDIIEGSYIDITSAGKKKEEKEKVDVKEGMKETYSEVKAEEFDEKTTKTEMEAENISKEKNVFYTETVLNEKTKKDNSGFKRFIAGVLVASLVGGPMIGVGFQVSKPLADKVAVMLESKETENSQTIQANNGDDTNNINNVVQVNTKTETTSVAPGVSIYKAVSPAVVGITTTITTPDYFNRSSYNSTSSGSGIVFENASDKVYVVTNYHVVENATKVVVTLNGGENVEANIVGADEQTDLAVLSVDKSKMKQETLSNIVVAVFGDSSELEIGEIAIAIGNPLGEQFSNSMSQGIISGLDRVIQVDDRNLTMIQTDAAINPGNSGGPLVNSKGQVVGINTVKYSDSSVEGMGFAIPTNIAKPIIEELMSKGYISRPLLGVRGITVTEEISEVWNYPVGVYVAGVTEGSAAGISGLAKGDVIVEFEGEKIFTMEQLTQLIKQHKVGDNVTIKYIRNGQTKETVAALQESTTTEETQTNSSTQQEESTPSNGYNNYYDFFNDYFNYYFNPFGR